MISRKNLLCGFLFSLCLLCCAGESFTAVSDEDAGRLLYWSRSGKSAVLVFRKRVTGVSGMSQWQCDFFRENGSTFVFPKDCWLLNYTEAELTPEIVAMELAYWTCTNAKSVRAVSYRLIAAKMNAPVTNNLLFFYNELNEHCRSALHAISEYKTAVRAKINNQEKRSVPSIPRSRPYKWKTRPTTTRPRPSNRIPQSSTTRSCPSNQRSCPSNQSSCPYNNSSNSSNTPNTAAALLEDGLLDSMKSAVAVKRIEDEWKKTDKNFFLAFCMYYKYRSVILQLQRLVPNQEIQKELAEDIRKLGEDIRKEYVNGRNRNQNRENSFRSVCRGTHGPWEWAPPADLKEMFQFVNSCYHAWQKTHSLSPYSEFPEWGNAMLEVLQMVQSSDSEQKFDTACAEYQKYNN